ncbi:hypothetical protein DH2020_017176 [Rehmannia glutinosa]|uniref:Uncharacterized protein n=1 Tax=Rehmannia glutinosa TaxID=99300 RepID=A0ABR0WRS4_REHGL
MARGPDSDLNKMVREGDHSSGVNISLISLLQERFRQLQRMKELRQEKEFLRMLSESEIYSPPAITYNYDELDSKTISGSEMFFPPPKDKPNCQLSLSLWPDSSIKRADSRGMIMVEAPSNLSKSCFTDAPLVCTSPIKLENSGSDIDTSLRL